MRYERIRIKRPPVELAPKGSLYSVEMLLRQRVSQLTKAVRVYTIATERTRDYLSFFIFGGFYVDKYCIILYRIYLLSSVSLLRLTNPVVE